MVNDLASRTAAVARTRAAGRCSPRLIAPSRPAKLCRSVAPRCKLHKAMAADGGLRSGAASPRVIAGPMAAQDCKANEFDHTMRRVSDTLGLAVSCCTDRAPGRRS